MNFLATSGLITIYPSLHWRRLGHENPVCCVKKTSRVTDLLLVKLLKVKLLKGNEEPGKERPFSPIGVLHYLDSLLQAFHTPYSCRGFIKKKKKTRRRDVRFYVLHLSETPFWNLSTLCQLVILVLFKQLRLMYRKPASVLHHSSCEKGFLPN